MANLSSWKCGDCTNRCLLMFGGEVFTYCKPAVEGRHRKKWVTEDFIDCLDKTTDPEAYDGQVRIHPAELGENKCG